MKNEVYARPSISQKTARLISMLFAIAAMSAILFMMGSSMANKDPNDFEVALESSDITEKLNFLIEVERIPFAGKFFYWLMLFLLFPLIASTDLVHKIWDYLFPSNLFLFGEKKRKHEARIAMMGKIFWGIGVALVVGVVAGFFVWKVTS